MHTTDEDGVSLSGVGVRSHVRYATQIIEKSHAASRALLRQCLDQLSRRFLAFD